MLPGLIHVLDVEAWDTMLVTALLVDLSKTLFLVQVMVEAATQALRIGARDNNRVQEWLLVAILRVTTATAVIRVSYPWR